MASRRGWGKAQVRQQPDARVRRSQVITTFGPGAMMDLVDQAVLVGGLDFWSYDKQRGTPVIVEPRLRDTLAEQFRAAKMDISQDRAFLEPPVGDEREPSRHVGMQVLEFPQWFVCQNPDCRALLRKDGLELKKGRYWHACSAKRKASETVPVRFVSACKLGHVQEFPWIRFVHEMRKKERCAAPTLTLDEGASGDFSQIRVRCACGESAQLSAATAGMPIKCSGSGRGSGRRAARSATRTSGCSCGPRATPTSRRS